MSDAIEGVATIIVVAIVLLIGVLAIGGVVETDGGVKSQVERSALLDGTGTFSSLGQQVGYDETVYDSRGFAANFTGSSDSYAESTSSPDLGTVGNWTVQTWARVDQGATSRNMTVVAAGGDVTLQYNGTRGNWTVYYFDRATRQTWRVDVNAPQQPANWTLVTATANETHLTIYANSAQGEVQAITGSNSADFGSYGNFDGRVDETRTFNDTANDSQISAAITDPIAPARSRDRTGRIMYDEPNRSPQQFFFADGGVAVNNASFSDGLDGQQLTRGDDYRWRDDGPQIAAVDGGEIDGSPVVYADYTREKETLGDFIDGYTGALSLVIVLIIVLALSIIMALMNAL